MPKFITPEEAVARIPHGATLMVGGFMGCGNAHTLVTALANSGKGELTLICNDGAVLNGPDGSECAACRRIYHRQE